MERNNQFVQMMDHVKCGGKNFRQFYVFRMTSSVVVPHSLHLFFSLILLVYHFCLFILSFFHFLFFTFSSFFFFFPFIYVVRWD